MVDAYGREINYMRVSVTDRCNLRCAYCNPQGFQAVDHGAVLRYEELLAICGAAVTLGITRFKVTGGEPFCRKGVVGFIGELKRLSGVTSVTVTTNGQRLAACLPALTEMGVDGVNVSLDACMSELYHKLTGGGDVDKTLSAIADCAAAGLRTKVNCVLLRENAGEIRAVARLAENGADVRFIEHMPIGGAGLAGVSADMALAALREAYPDLSPTDERRGNGPAVYYKTEALNGRIGFIAANSRAFCDTCNRVRLTATGFLKPCLCYEDGADLRAMLRSGAGGGELRAALAKAISAKPKGHCFQTIQDVTEQKSMRQIGG